MASIAPCPKIVEIESQIRPLIDCLLMVAVKVTFSAVVSDAKLGEYLIYGRVAKVIDAAVSDNSRFPVAIDAAPTVAQEALDTQAAMVRIVPALCTCATLRVLLTLSRDSV